jgi:hypothetical protein
MLLGLVSGALGAQQPPPLFAELRRMFPWDGIDTPSIVAADIDGDGDVDAVAGNIGLDGLYLNDGFGRFSDASSNLPPDADFTQSVAVGDVDSDGDLDLLFLNSYLAHPPRLCLNLGSGSAVFVNAQGQLPALASTESGHRIVLGDVDGDGDLDALLGFSAGPTQWCLRLWLNDGLGTFVDVTPSHVPGLFSSGISGGVVLAIALGDLDGDGDLDALVDHQASNNPVPQQNRLLLNSGTGVFTDATGLMPVIADWARAIVLHDLDGDGDLDVVVAADSTSGLQASYVLLNLGGLAFAGPFVLPSGPTHATAVVVADLEPDGDVDAVVSGFTGEKVLYLNAGTGLQVVPTAFPAAGDGTLGLAAADVDGDSDVDLFAANYGTTNHLYLNDGAAAFTASSAAFPGFSSSPKAVVLLDVEGDGDRDAFVSDPNGVDRLFINNGAGVFTGAPAQLPQAPGTHASAAGDCNGDGWVDLVASGGYYNPGHRLYLNGGAGTFVDASPNLPTIAAYRGPVVLGDLDGDFDLDAIVGTGGGLAQFVNGGTGVFTLGAPPVMQPVGAVPSAALGDVDGDADLDLYVVASPAWPCVGCTPLGGQDHLFRNAGGGVFVDVTASSLPLENDEGTSVALGDVDGDGDLDALLGRTATQPRLYLNNGSGVFTDATSQLPVASGALLRLSDVDEDGDLDAVGPTRLWLNGGLGTFTDASGLLPAASAATTALAVADLDGDADPDLLLGIPGQDSRILSNLRRQLAWRALPRLGKPLSFDVWGPPGGVMAFGADATTTSVLLPPYGTLHLSPQSATVFGIGALDTQGRASLTFLVPGAASLLGATFYAQAIVGFPVRLTNLEVVTLTGF